ncbi:MAG: hypothetical protein IJ655_05250 [Lachnospiraceae bacterium]|nr:hypothetical protein [Lachnospiraceae bacterium]
MMVNVDKKKKDLYFVISMIIFAVFVEIRYFEHSINPQDTTAFAFSYKYGFISRGFMGTLLQVLDSVMSRNLLSYKGIYYISFVATVVLIGLIIYMFYKVLQKVDDKKRLLPEAIMAFIAINAFPMYFSRDNFGRLDVYLTIIMIVSILLIQEEKFEWLLVPLSILAMLIHHGYVFMNVNIVLVLLLYKAAKTEAAQRKKYLILFALVFIAVSIMFLYFEFFSHLHGEAIYQEIHDTAAAISEDGQSVNDSLLKHEILGLDVYDDEYAYRRLNQVEFPKYLVLYSPILVAALMLIIEIIKNAKDRFTKMLHVMILLGGVTVLPEMVLKVDYGRYVFALILYYSTILLVLIAMGDEAVDGALTTMRTKYKKFVWAIPGLLIYAMIFVPYRAVRISEVVNTITFFIYGFH